jgi:POT family proton-dependent oligopeptide transporter
MVFSLLRKFPKGLYPLALGNAFDTFSYYGTQTLLALYLIHVFGFSKSYSYLLYGSFASLGYFIPILGGLLGDKVFGSRNTVILGAITAILGNLLLISLHYNIFLIGLAATVLGTGLYKSNSAKLIGSIYAAKTENKEGGYTIFYLAINLGGTFAPLVYGVVAYKYGWNYGFLCSAFGISLGLLLFLINFKRWPTATPNLSKRLKTLVCLGTISICVIIGLMFQKHNLIAVIPILIFSCGLIYLIHSIMKASQEYRKPLFGLLILNFFAMFYFIAGLQTGSTITIYIQNTTNFPLPASVFNMMYCGFVLLLAPLFSWLWGFLKYKGISISAPGKLLTGIIFSGIGILFFALTSKFGHFFIGVIIGYLFLSAGELVLTPAIYAAISNHAPENLKSTMIGAWFLFIGMGSYLSSVLSRISSTLAQKFYASSFYFSQFMMICFVTFCIAIVFALFLPKLRKIVA